MNLLTQFDSDLTLVANDPQMVENAHQISESFLRQRGPTPEDFAIQPHLPKTYLSEKKISDRAKSLMTTFEVSGKAVYERKYIHPILPGVKSGLTIGIGYDMGYTESQDFEDDWAPFLASDVIARLKPACGHPGESEVTLPSMYSDIEIPWAAAEQQFEIAIKQTAGQTEHVFPRSSELSPDSFGALVDLVYNRGGALKRDPSDPDDRRREMRMIRQLLLTGNLKDIPDQLIAMKRLWVGDSRATGLLKRRDIEAELFRAGLG
ncbi:hypothetical protein [Rhizobium sp. F40D2]|uniref:hypothetical protein n=1 Tax=Rhizobium sp. F40D2 TaxID=3453141 RepID=UPI003F28BED6